MAITYRYIAHTVNGQRLEGFFEGENEKAVADYLRSQGYYISSIIPHKRGILSKDISLNFSFGKKVRLRELAVFCRQFATMLNAGIPLLDTLFVLQKQTDNHNFRKALQGVRESLNQGSSLSEAMDKYPKVFPAIFVNMIKAGEAGGVLDDVLERAAEFFEKEHDMREKVKTALTYPCFVIVAAIAVVWFLLVYIVPKFLSVFEGMKAELPFYTLFLIRISNFLTSNWLTIVVCAGAFSMFSFLFFRTKRGKGVKDFALFYMPVFGSLFKRRITADFCRTFATLLASGVPILDVLDILAKISANQIVTNGILAAQEGVRTGKGIAEQLEKDKVFPLMVTKMIAVGESSGTLDVMLHKLADFYERELDYLTGRMTSLLEPLLIFILGGIVAFIMLSVFTPILSLVTTI